MTTPVWSLQSRERIIILSSLLVLTLASWAFLVWWAMQDDGMTDGGMAQDTSLTMGMGAPLFLLTWVVMMVAMMFPAAAPMILMFSRIHEQKRARSQSFVPTWIFVAGYLVVWSLAGVLAFGGALGAERLATESMWIMDNAARIGAGLLIGAAIYQLSPLKHACLVRCRTPMQFILTSWRDGNGGAFRMGVEHGGYCLGCCWLLFVMLFPLGVMNVGAMAMIALLVFGEKALPRGRSIAYAGAVILAVYGVAILFRPELLPTSM